MAKRVRAHVRAHIVGYLALFVALGGTAVALPGKRGIDKNDLRKNVVGTKHIKPNAARGVDVNEGTLNFTCPAGKLEGVGFCLDSADRAPAEWQDAVSDCANENGYLPSTAELSMSIDELGLGPATPALWTENLWFDGGPVAHSFDASPGVPVTADAGNAQAYRCAYPLVRQ